MNSAPRPRHRLTRSTRNKQWFGVAAGMAEYLDVEPSLMRVIWAVATILTGGMALLIYLAMAVIMPRDDQAAANEPPSSSDIDYGQRRRNLWGILLVLVGAVLLAGSLGFWRWFEWRFVWPLILIGLGVFLLIQRVEEGR